MIDNLAVRHRASLLTSSISNTDLPSGIRSVAARSSEGERGSPVYRLIGSAIRAFGFAPRLAGERPISPPRQSEGEIGAGNGRASSLSGDHDSDVSFGCVWSAQRPLGNVDRRRWREHVGERGPRRVFWGVVLFEDRSCLMESRWWHGSAGGPLVPVVECLVEFAEPGWSSGVVGDGDELLGGCDRDLEAAQGSGSLGRGAW